MIITEFYARLDDISPSFRSNIDMVTHLLCKHQGRILRDSGEPYLEHCYDVMAQLLEIGINREIGMDEDVIAAGGLHDIVEDTGLNLDIIAECFNQRTAFLVDSCSKRPKEYFRKKKDRLADLHQRIIAAAQMPNGYPVIFIRGGCRYHNLLTLHNLFKDRPKQLRVSRETLRVYVPLFRYRAKAWVPRVLHPWLNEYAYKMERLAQIILYHNPLRSQT